MPQARYRLVDTQATPYYHCISRCVRRAYLCGFDRASRKNFDHRKLWILDRIKLLSSVFAIDVCAYAIMSNHFHLVLHVDNESAQSWSMDEVIDRWLTLYTGPIVAHRYKAGATLITAEQGALANWVETWRARMAADAIELESYRWTGHAGMLGKYRQDWHKTSQTLGYFVENTRRAKKNYLRFLRDTNSHSSRTDIAGGGLIRSFGGWENLKELRKEHIYCVGDERILGSSAFVENVLRLDDLAIKRRQMLVRNGWNLDKLALCICEETGVTQGQLQSKAPKGSLSEAKSMLCYLGVVELGIALREIAGYLSISTPSVSAWVKKGSLLCQTRGISIAALDR